MFGGLYDLNLETSKFKFHENYLEMEMDPIFHRPSFDNPEAQKLEEQKEEEMLKDVEKEVKECKEAAGNNTEKSDACDEKKE